MLGHEKNHVDLRVLVVAPFQAVEDLLHVALDDFRFTRLCEAHDVESACDQLMFNGFDLVIVHGLEKGRIQELANTISSGVLGNTGDMPMQVFCQDDDCAPTEHMHVSPPDLDLHQISRVLKHAFSHAHRFHDRVRLAHSRMLRQSHQLTSH